MAAATYSKVFAFDEFPGKLPEEIVLFSDGMREFVNTWAEQARYVDIYDETEHVINRTWLSLLIRKTPGYRVIPLYTVEEQVEYLADRCCTYCRCTGWGDHLMTRKRYHFIIPMDADWRGSINEGIPAKNLLHGLIHQDGYGHLIEINGIGGGSSMLTGRDLMDLWDRICNTLPTRFISIQDESMKGGNMHARLLHGVAYKMPWFGSWGYIVGNETFEVTEYKKATTSLHSLSMEEVHAFTDERRGDLEALVARFKNISEVELKSLGELLSFVLTSDEASSNDIKLIYDNVLLSKVEDIQSSRRSILRSKHLRKKWRPKECKKSAFILVVYLAGQLTERMELGNIQYLPITVKAENTVLELKKTIKNLLMQTYYLIDNFEIGKVVGSIGKYSAHVEQESMMASARLMKCNDAFCSNWGHVHCKGPQDVFWCGSCTKHLGECSSGV